MDDTSPSKEELIKCSSAGSAGTGELETSSINPKALTMEQVAPEVAPSQPEQHDKRSLPNRKHVRRPLEPIMNVNEPKWMDTCNRKGANESFTIVNLHIGLESSRHAFHRRKRSIFTHKQQKVVKSSRGSYDWQISPIGGDLVDEKSTILFKKPLRSSKKTTFAISSSPSASRSIKAPKQRNKSRYFTAPQELQHTKIVANPPQLHPQDQLVKSLVETLYAHDVKLSWLITGSLSTLNNTRKLTHNLVEAIKLEPDRLRDSDPARAQEIENQLKWLPSLGELVPNTTVANLTGGFYSKRTQTLILNMTHYVEFFSAASEQMTFEQQTFNKKLAPIYNDLEIHLHMIICEMDNIIKLSEFYKSKERALQRWLESYYADKTAKESLGSRLGDLAPYYRQLIDRSQREQPKIKRETELHQRLVLQSPLVRFLEERGKSHIGLEQTPEAAGDLSRGFNNEHNWNLQPQNMCSSTHVGREVMPLEQRRLRSDRERSFRDELILGKLLNFLSSYETLLVNNAA